MVVITNQKKEIMDSRLKLQSGFAYIWILVTLIFLSFGLGQWSINYATLEQREKEQELLRIGFMYRNAIHQYYESSPGGLKEYPNKLEDLLRDPRSLEIRRYLRKLEKDPMTSLDFETKKNANGQIIAIYSGLDKLPIKQKDFPIFLKHFEKAKTYQDWLF